MLFALPHTISGDGAVRYIALQNLVERGRIDNIKCSYLVSLLAAPIYFLGRASGDSIAWCARFNTIVTALAFLAAGRLLRPHCIAGLHWRFLLLLLAASMWGNHLRNFYGETLTAALVLVGGILLATQRRLAGWVLLVLATVNMPACGIGLGLVALNETWRTRRLRHLLPVAAAAALIVLERFIQTGQLFVTGYEGDKSFPTVMPYSGQVGFSYPFYFGIAAILFSFGKGILWFAPGLLLTPRSISGDGNETLRRACHVWLWYLAGMVLAYSRWWAWYGGWCWGPRFFLIASLPASAMLAMALTQADSHSPPSRAGSRMLTAFACLLSAWVGVCGAVFDTRTMDFLLGENYKYEFLTWHMPEYSVLGWPLVNFDQWDQVAHRLVLSTQDAIVLAFCVTAVAVAAGPWFLESGRLAWRAARSAVSAARSRASAGTGAAA